MAVRLTAMSTNMFARAVVRTRSLSCFDHIVVKPLWIQKMGCFQNSSVQTSQRRAYSHHPPFPYPEIPSAEAAKSFVVHLDDRGRSLLLNELSRVREESEKTKSAVKNMTTIQVTQVTSQDATTEVSRAQFWEVIMYHGIPFIGFGILDNMIMIIAGEYIDVTLGTVLGISTMAAAALGNLISDLAGVGTAGYVELLASKVGVKPPDITPAQALSQKVRWAVGLGRSLGITIGCIIGMFPLLFFPSDKDDSDKDELSDVGEKTEELTKKVSMS